MKCKGCDIEIDICKPPFGAYFCKNDHAQCGACDLSLSHCLVCGDDVETKYKSPHFPSEKHSSDLQVPMIRTIEHSDGEEEEFQKLRYSFLNGHFEEKQFFRRHAELNSVRTLSALIAKDLYPIEAKKVDSDLRFQKIMNTLRETDCPSDHSNESDSEQSDETLKAETELKNQSQLSVLFPQRSSQRFSNTKQRLSNCFSNIRSKSDSKLQTEASKISLINPENSIPKFQDFKAVSCLNIVENPPIDFPITIEAESLDYHPFDCPISSCVGKLFISNFNHHIIHDHPLLPISKIKFGEFRELDIDVNRCTWAPHSVACFFMQNIVQSYSSPAVKDALPMLLMIGRYRFKDNQISSISLPNDKPWTCFDCLVIWLIGVMPEQCEITVYISVFSSESATFSRWLVDNLNRIQDSSNIETIFENSRRLVLSFREVQFLTNDFQETLRCHVGLVNYGIKS